MNEILNTDALTGLKQLDSESIDCCITSPPYFGLRDYKTEGQIGLEPTFELYLEHLNQIFNEVKRVLKKEGSCWVVIGDTYGGTGENRNGLNGVVSKRIAINKVAPIKSNNVMGKSLLLIPERFAIKMLDSGWILRNKIIWYKPNCMPSSAKDRFTVDYEHILFFVKSKKYYFKTQHEPLQQSTIERDKYTRISNGKDGPYAIDHKHDSKSNGITRIKRTVWKIPPKPFPDAHFAVFPEELVKQCLDAGCPSNGVTLDPFMGSGTVALVALKTNRQFIGIELNKDYINIANRRIEPYLLQAKLI